MNEVKAYPAWRAAVKQFVAAGFKEGDVVPHSWFYEAFGIEQPTPTMSYKKASDLELRRLKQFDKLEDALLEEHKVALQNVPGEGYQVVPPGEQAKMGYTMMVGGIQKAIRDGMNVVGNVKYEQLTDAQRKEQADYLARASMLREMHKRQRRLPRPE